MITVVVPIYNVEKYLRRCIDSIINQTYNSLEIILVDDGSTDNSGIIADEYIEIDNRIKVLHKKNEGLSSARNAGIDIATGEYLIFVDSDDYIHPQMCDILFNNLLKNNADISVCDFNWIDENVEITNSITNNIVIINKEKINNLLISNNLITVVAWNKLYSKRLFEHIRYPIGRLHEDEFIIHKLLYECKKVVYTDAKLYNYIRHKNTITTNISINGINDTIDALKERIAFYKEKQLTIEYCESIKQYINCIIEKRLKISSISEGKEIVKLLQKRIREVLPEAIEEKVMGKRKILCIWVWSKSWRMGEMLLKLYNVVNDI